MVRIVRSVRIIGAGRWENCQDSTEKGIPDMPFSGRGIRGLAVVVLVTHGLIYRWPQR